MPRPGPATALSELTEAELLPLARIADRLLRDRSLLVPGHRPTAERIGRGMEFIDHSDYVPGQDIRHVDWRASARRRSLQVRRFQDERFTDWTICIDHSSSMLAPGPHKWRLASQLAASVGFLLLHLGNRVALQMFGTRIEHTVPFGRGRRQFGRLLGLLEHAPPARGRGASLECCAPRIPALAPAIVISDFLAADHMLPGLRRLAATGRQVQVLRVLDAADTRLDGDAPLELVDVETGETREVLDPALAAAVATDTLARAVADVQQQCAAWQIHYTACPVQAGWRSATLAHLKGLWRA